MSANDNFIVTNYGGTTGRVDGFSVFYPQTAPSTTWYTTTNVGGTVSFTPAPDTTVVREWNGGYYLQGKGKNLRLL